MKRFLSLAVLSALCAGLLTAACPAAADNSRTPGGAAGAGSQMSPSMQTFYNGLSSDAKRKFDELDPMHRQRAMDMGGDSSKAVERQYNDQRSGSGAAGSQMNPSMQTFYNALSSDAKRKFDELDPMHRQRAVDMGGDPSKAVERQYSDQKGGAGAGQPPVAPASTTAPVQSTK